MIAPSAVELTAVITIYLTHVTRSSSGNQSVSTASCILEVVEILIYLHRYKTINKL